MKQELNRAFCLLKTSFEKDDLYFYSYFKKDAINLNEKILNSFLCRYYIRPRFKKGIEGLNALLKYVQKEVPLKMHKNRGNPSDIINEITNDKKFGSVSV